MSKPNILLLCCGRKSHRYGKYYKSSLQIDLDGLSSPDIVFNLRLGLPKQIINCKFYLIQAVNWPLLHQIFSNNMNSYVTGGFESYRTFHQIGNGNTTEIVANDISYIRRDVLRAKIFGINFNLLKDISNCLYDDGFFVFSHEGEIEILNRVMEFLNMKRSTIEEANHKLGITILPFSESSIQRDMTQQYYCYKKIRK